MRDEMDGRAWTENHECMCADMDRLFDKLAAVFRKLVAIEYESPWLIVAARERCRTDCS